MVSLTSSRPVSHLCSLPPSSWHPPALLLRAVVPSGVVSSVLPVLLGLLADLLVYGVSAALSLGDDAAASSSCRAVVRSRPIPVPVSFPPLSSLVSASFLLVRRFYAVFGWFRRRFASFELGLRR